ncbi:MAG: hypothetical protein VX836_10440 [Pseudomonadota bacterium]|nr:hypothetical protein [Pseudomonadota bacterium]
MDLQACAGQRGFFSIRRSRRKSRSGQVLVVDSVLDPDSDETFAVGFVTEMPARRASTTA